MDFFMKLIGGVLGAFVGALLVVLLTSVMPDDGYGFARLGFAIRALPVGASIGFILGFILAVLYGNLLKDKRDEEEALMPDVPEKHPDDWRYH